MAQSVLVTLTTAQVDSGPFNLYSDADAYAVPVATGISRTTMLGGYVVIVPDSATIIKVLSTGVCDNYSLIPISNTTTSTTTSTSTSTTTSTSSSTTTTTTSTSSTTTTTTTQQTSGSIPPSGSPTVTTCATDGSLSITGVSQAYIDQFMTINSAPCGDGCVQYSIMNEGTQTGTWNITAC